MNSKNIWFMFDKFNFQVLYILLGPIIYYTKD